MKLPRWMPRPTAWASGLALSVFAQVVGELFGFAVPILLSLMHESPRLAWIGVLILWLSPMALAAGIHGFVSRLIGPAMMTPRQGPLVGAASWWAGFVAWAAIIVITAVKTILLLILIAPPIGDSGSIWDLVAVARNEGGIVNSLVSIVLGAYLYELEARARPSGDTAQCHGS